jgi:hypothetical protein
MTKNKRVHSKESKLSLYRKLDDDAFKDATSTYQDKGWKSKLAWMLKMKEKEAIAQDKYDKSRICPICHLNGVCSCASEGNEYLERAKARLSK